MCYIEGPSHFIRSSTLPNPETRFKKRVLTVSSRITCSAVKCTFVAHDVASDPITKPIFASEYGTLVEHMQYGGFLSPSSLSNGATFGHEMCCVLICCRPHDSMGDLLLQPVCHEDLKAPYSESSNRISQVPALTLLVSATE